MSLDGVAVHGPRAFVEGGFLSVGGLAMVDGIAAFVGGAWTNVGSDADGTSGPASGTMKAIRVAGEKLYVGGLDTAIGGGSLNAFASWYRLRQPDGQIATTGAYVGNNLYDSTGASQTKSLTVHRGSSGTFNVKICNDGWAADTITLKGPGSGSGFTVTYTVKVAVASSVAVNTTRSWLVRATSTGPGATKDAVKATVKPS